jgi:hypothetical protein
MSEVRSRAPGLGIPLESVTDRKGWHRWAKKVLQNWDPDVHQEAYEKIPCEDSDLRKILSIKLADFPGDNAEDLDEIRSLLATERGRDHYRYLVRTNNPHERYDFLDHEEKQRWSEFSSKLLNSTPWTPELEMRVKELVCSDKALIKVIAILLPDFAKLTENRTVISSSGDAIQTSEQEYFLQNREAMVYLKRGLMSDCDTMKWWIRRREE